MWFEDMYEGLEVTTAEVELTREEMLDFAGSFDPQPFHLGTYEDGVGPFGDIIASGFHTVAAAWGLWVRTGVPADHGAGGLGMEDCRWLRPVYPGTRIHAVVRVSELRLTSKGQGFQRLDFSVRDQDQTEVLRFSTFGLLRRRATEPEGDDRAAVNQGEQHA